MSEHEHRNRCIKRTMTRLTLQQLSGGGRYAAVLSSNTVHYGQVDNCFLTPSQPRRSYQGDSTTDTVFAFIRQKSRWFPNSTSKEHTCELPFNSDFVCIDIHCENGLIYTLHFTLPFTLHSTLQFTLISHYSSGGCILTSLIS